MTQPEAPQLTETELTAAAQNYSLCLNLEPESKVLIVTDDLPTDTTLIDDNGWVRRIITDRLSAKLTEDGHHLSTIKFNSQTSREDMKAQSLQALRELDLTTDDRAMTVIYLGDAWSNRPGLYAAADEFGEDREVRFAGSLGFSTGDARVMSQIGPEQLTVIRETNEYFETFFGEHPTGRFEIMTSGKDGEEHKLYLDYDTTIAPFETDMGQVGREYGVMIGKRKYSNIPGGEKFASPFPYKNTNGSFATEGMTFHVVAGLVTEIDITEEIDITKLAHNQRDLINAVREGKKIPVTELGLGFYAMAGIKTYSDSSTLSLEKGGPHCGFGHAVSDTPEEKEMAELAGEFHHSDMVLDNPVINHIDLQTQAQTPFYPPNRNQ